MPATLTLDLLERALDQTGTVIARVRSDQARLPTPCSPWDLRALINHVVYDLQTFVTMLTAEERGSPDVDLIDDDWPAAYRSAADTLMATWRQRGTDGTLKLHIGEVPLTWAIGQHLADVAVHGWDVARATGQATDLDPEVAQVALDWARENLKPHFRGQAFGPEVDVPADAPIYDRLAGFFGRKPT